MQTNIEQTAMIHEKEKYGGFWIRTAAALIDLIILGIPLSI
ncbi:hypothetical protein [Mesobacillus zeae]|nr:hypothetical protein [Mesobacillus zeae]